MRIEELESIWQIWIKWQSGLDNVTSFPTRVYGTLNRIHYLHFSYLVRLSSEFILCCLLITLDDSLLLRLTFVRTCVSTAKHTHAHTHKQTILQFTSVIASYSDAAAGGTCFNLNRVKLRKFTRSVEKIYCSGCPGGRGYTVLHDVYTAYTS